MAKVSDDASDRVIDVVREDVSVDKRVVERGRVRVRKIVREEQHVVDEPLLHEEAVIERVPVNRYVDEAPAIRRDGDELVVPCVEEVLVVEKRLLLREELRVRLARSQRHDPREVTVRREDVVVDRSPPEDE